MCVLCYSLSGTEHWTDAHPGSEPAVSVRARRRHLLAAILAAEGLDCDDDPSGLTSIVSDRKGEYHGRPRSGRAVGCRRAAGRAVR